jgi:hypothetical protein
MSLLAFHTLTFVVFDDSMMSLFAFHTLTLCVYDVSFCFCFCVGHYVTPLTDLHEYVCLYLSVISPDLAICVTLFSYPEFPIVKMLLYQQ